MALARLGRKAEAREAIEHARQLAPDDPKVHRVLAEIGGGTSVVTWIIRLFVLAIFAGVALYVLKILKDTGVLGGS